MVKTQAIYIYQFQWRIQLLSTGRWKRRQTKINELFLVHLSGGVTCVPASPSDCKYSLKKEQMLASTSPDSHYGLKKFTMSIRGRLPLTPLISILPINYFTEAIRRVRTVVIKLQLNLASVLLMRELIPKLSLEFITCVHGSAM